MPHVTSRSWTDADIARLRKLSDEGASVNRAAAALNRKTDAVKKVCRVHGLTLVSPAKSRSVAISPMKTFRLGSKISSIGISRPISNCP